MEEDDVATTNISCNGSGAGGTTQIALIVECEDAPCDYLVALSHNLHLRRGDAGIGWSEEVAMYNIRGEIYILDISLASHTPPLLMRVGVVAYAMARLDDFGVEVGIHLYIFAQHEECCLGIVSFEGGQYPLCNTWRRTIIEGDIYAPIILDAPNYIGK